MGRVSNLVNWAGKSATHLGPLDVVFAFSDYANGKKEGEDDIRAGAGAIASGLGGWGGAAVGAGIGQALIPIPGIGAAIGAIGGSIAGGYISGWGADRADEAIRGDAGLKKQTQQETKNMDYFDKNGNYIGSDDGGAGQFLANNGTKLVAGATTAYGAKKLADTFIQNQPLQAYKTAVNGGTPAMDAVKAVGHDLISEPWLRNAGKIIKPLAVATGLSAADDLFFGGGIKRTVGNAVGGTVDAITGNRTNLDGNPEDARKQQQLRQMQSDVNYQRKEAGIRQQSNDITLQQMIDDPGQRFIEYQNNKAQDRQKQNEQEQWDRARKAQLENSRYNLSATFARDLMSHWDQSAQNVNNAMQTIGRASFL